MAESKTYYFYLWRHYFFDPEIKQLIWRTCFGITSNPAGRIQGYEGHVGHVVKFDRMWSGPERLIRELESRVKSDFADYLFVGTNDYRYEWINEEVELETINQWIDWEVENTFIGINTVENTQ
jgi:hypothetical protein